MKRPRAIGTIADMKTGCRLQANRLEAALKRNYKTMLLCLIATLAWGLVAHAYIFLHSSFSHDSLHEFNAEVFGNDWRIQLGRVFVPAYRAVVRGSITLPWLIGMLSLVYIAFAVFLTVKIFDIRSGFFTVLVCGIFTCNLTVTATAATYIHDLDCNMLAMALAVLAVYCWKKYNKGFLVGMLPLCAAIGLYQGFVSVAITLILFDLVLQLLDGASFGSVFCKGLKGIGMILGSCVLYFLAIVVVCRITGVDIRSGSYNSVDTVFAMSVPEILSAAIDGYKKTCITLLTATSVYSKKMMIGIHTVLIAVPGVIIVLRLFQKQIRMKEKLLTLLLIALMPLGMNIVYILTRGMSHDLMYFAIWLVYLFVLLIAWRTVARCPHWKPLVKYGQRVLAVGLTLLLLWGNVQTANAAYLKKDLEHQATVSLLTRVVYRMEQCPQYDAGQTPVVFVGRPDTLLEKIEGFEAIYTITGSESPYALGAADLGYYRAYFDDILLKPVVLAEPALWWEMRFENSTVANMPCYPAEGSIAMLDGVLIVKLGG